MVEIKLFIREMLFEQLYFEQNQNIQSKICFGTTNQSNRM